MHHLSHKLQVNISILMILIITSSSGRSDLIVGSLWQCHVYHNAMVLLTSSSCNQ